VSFDPLAWASVLEASPLGVAMRGSKGLYPTANVAHVIGLVLLLGAVGVLDLRVAGLGPAVPLAPLSRMLTPFVFAGFAVQAASGFLLFAADAGLLMRSPVFLVKLALIGLALVNALLFRLWFGDWEHGTQPPATARWMAVSSIALWTVAAVLGRLIAYR
jgi:hypothetical protein